MSELEKFLNEVRTRADKATKGVITCTDSYIEVKDLDGERGEILAEFFGTNPCYGDNSNDTHFYANAKQDIEKLLRIVGVLREALRFQNNVAQNDRSVLGSLKFIPQPHHSRAELEDSFNTQNIIITKAITSFPQHNFEANALSEADKIAGEP